MSEQNEDPFAEEKVAGSITPPTQESTTETPAPAIQKIFTRNDIKRSVNVSLWLPKMYVGYEPWDFELRLKLSKEAEERRQEYLSLAAAEMTVKLPEQALDEICDLLVSLPKGFGDLAENGNGPGASFRSYVETADSEAKALLLQIVEGADNLYWASISPREFHR